MRGAGGRGKEMKEDEKEEEEKKDDDDDDDADNMKLENKAPPL